MPESSWGARDEGFVLAGMVVLPIRGKRPTEHTPAAGKTKLGLGSSAFGRLGARDMAYLPATEAEQAQLVLMEAENGVAVTHADAGDTGILQS